MAERYLLDSLPNNEIPITPKLVLGSILVGGAVLFGITALGYYWTGGKNAEQVVQMKKEKMAEQLKIKQQKQQTAQQRAMGREGPEITFEEVYAKAKRSYNKGKFEESNELCKQALSLIMPTDPTFSAKALELTTTVVTNFIELVQAEEALGWLEFIETIIDKQPDFTITLNYIKSQVLDYLNRDDEVMALIASNIEQARVVFGETHARFFHQLATKGAFLIKKGLYNEAIEDFRRILEYLKETRLQSSNGSKLTLSNEEITYHRYIQRCFFLDGQLDKGLEILEFFKANVDDRVTIDWQIHHCGTTLFEAEYNEEGEKYLREILEKYPIPDTGEFETTRIKSLVSNTVSELALHLYNFGKKEEAEKYFQLIEKHKWGVLSSSIYFVAKQANILFSPKNPNDPNSPFTAHINCDFSFSKRVKDGMYIEFESENYEGPHVVAVEVKPGQITARFKGNETKNIEPKVYKVIAKVYPDSSKSKLLFTHIQFVPSSIDTSKYKTWGQVQSSFQNRKK